MTLSYDDDKLPPSSHADRVEQDLGKETIKQYGWSAQDLEPIHHSELGGSD